VENFLGGAIELAIVYHFAFSRLDREGVFKDSILARMQEADSFGNGSEAQRLFKEQQFRGIHQAQKLGDLSFPAASGVLRGTFRGDHDRNLSLLTAVNN
jgi:hypothetical protein